MRKILLGTVLAIVGFAVFAETASLSVDGDVPAGNIIVVKTEGDVVTLKPDLRDTAGDWFYWAFRVCGAAGRTLTFKFTGAYDGNVVGVRGPVVSLDKGQTWSYPCDGASKPNTFTYVFPKNADEVWFYECHPYHQSDWEAFLARHADQRGKFFETGVLCQSPKGRDVEKARFGCLTNPKYTLLLTSRHHASEAVATYALEGFLDAVLAQDELGAWLRANVEVMVVPFMDKDGCVDGDQGKNRKPHDHNRDYTEFIHPETKATVAWIKERTNDQLDVWIDLHCPWIRGHYNEFVYAPFKRDVNNRNLAAERTFDALLEKLQCGSLKYKTSDDLPYGQAWNTGGNYAKGWSAINWAINKLPAIKLGHTFEIPFANANGAVVTPDKVRDLGRDLAKTLRAFLEQKPVCFSGVYPHLAMVNDEGECGTGAVVPWAGSLWAITYGPHCPCGSSDKLYQIKPDLTRVIRPESVGGTPANRLIHRETDKLLIGQYVISSNAEVEAVWISRMPGRLTGAARHLEDPARKVYVTDMEEALYELDMTDPSKTFTYIRDGHNRAAFNAYFKKWNRTPPPGWNEAEDSTLFGYHGKGTCSGFGKVFYANNGQYSPAAMKDPRTPAGSLAFWKPGMKNWELIRTNQFTEVTTRDGVYGNEHPATNPIWALGWDHRSVILTTTADGETWTDFRLPKGSHSYDGAHGWNTEWPRIREIGTGDDFLATMHGTFWKFPADFAPNHAAGVRPRSTYLKVIGDFARWGDRVVFGCDDHAKSEFLNTRALKGTRAKARQSESNLWFVEPERLDALGPREGKGAVWSGDTVAAGQTSDAFLFAGYERKWLWLTVRAEAQIDEKGTGEWKTWKRLRRGGHDLTGAPKAEWVRLVARDAGTNVFAVFHYTSPRAEVSVAPFTQTAPDAAATVFENDAPIPQGLITEDAASLVYMDNGVRRRLPRRAETSAATCGRLCREVSTERDLLHVGEIFYELPADNAGGFKFVHPVAASPRQICDYDTWKGCLVLKELSNNATNLFIGVADDLWRLGKPVGVGGPWMDTAVRADEPSDAYLMNGFDRKVLKLRTDVDAQISLEADIDGCGTWVPAGTFSVKAGAAGKTVGLPAAFSAYWVRVRSNVACAATAQFTYW